MNSPHKGQWRGALMFSLICAWINGWVNNREAGDLRCHRAHYDVSVMARVKPNLTDDARVHNACLRHLTPVCSRFAGNSHSMNILLCFNTLWSRQNSRLLADNTFKCKFLNKNVWILIKISLKYVSRDLIGNKPALVQIMAWHQNGLVYWRIYASPGQNDFMQIKNTFL